MDTNQKSWGKRIVEYIIIALILLGLPFVAGILYGYFF